MRLVRRLIVPVLIITVASATLSAQQTGACGPVDYFHPKILDRDHHLDSWCTDENGPFDSALDLSADWWAKAPDVNGWPSWCSAAVLDRNYRQSNGAIPGSACSFAIMACLKYYVYTGDTAYLAMARRTGEYIINQALTPPGYKCYPSFPYAVGSLGNIHPDGSGHPSYNPAMNPPGNIQPDKGAMLGVALLELYKVTGSGQFLKAAINIADCLAENASRGTALNSPWPMRVMADSGTYIDGKFSANVSYACRLFDELLRLGHKGNGKYKKTRNMVWTWLKTNVIAYDHASGWQNFFEDHGGDEINPTQINALETARYLMEKKEKADKDWFRLAGMIIGQVQKRWALTDQDREGYICIAEQEQDKSPYNSHTARFGSILAMFYEAGGDTIYRDMAYHSLCYGIYSIEDDGFTNTYYRSGDRGRAWTSDSFGDFLSHYMDAFAAVPEWAGNENHMLYTGGTVKSISYKGTNHISYACFDPMGTDKLKLIHPPKSVTVDGRIYHNYKWDNHLKVLLIKRENGKNVEINL